MSASWAANRAGRIIIPAIALATGIAVGWSSRPPQAWTIWLWLGAAAAALMVGAATTLWLRNSNAAASTALAVALASLGAARVILQQHYVSQDDLSAMVGDDSAIVRLAGVAVTSPELRHRTGGALARFDYRQPATYFRLQVRELAARDGARRPACGEVLVRVDEPVAPFHAGDHVQVTGFLMQPAVPRNPGEFNYREYARSLGQAGVLTVGRKELLMVAPTQRRSLFEMFLNWRDQLRHRAGEWLLGDESTAPPSKRNALLASLLLGHRDEQIDGVYGVFQRVGLAHLLAISGFHLGVLAGFVVLVARMIFGNRRWHGWLVIGFVLLYLVLVEARMPVLRAGVMTVLAGLGLVFGRRLSVSGLVWLSAIALLLWRPDQLFNAGFQLTFGVVLALIHLSPILRRRLFGPSNPEAATTGAMVMERLKTSCTVAMTAWLIAMPIAMHHFGMISPLAVLLTIITLPLAAVILAIGFVKMAVAVALPSVAQGLGVPLGFATDALLGIVMLADEIPGSVVRVHPPPTAWTIMATICVSWLIIGDRRVARLMAPMESWLGRGSDAGTPPLEFPGGSARRGIGRIALVKWCAAIGLVAWLIRPERSDSALRIDMLAVGDGSCYVIRSGGSAVVFDCGSSTDLNVGRRSLIPAMRRLGVRSIDALLISHADLDHYSAVLELIEEFPVREVLLTPQFVGEGADHPDGPVAFAIERFNEERMRVETVAAGTSRRYGAATWTWLNPQPDRAYPLANNSSMVIQIQCAGRCILLCGDIQREAMAELLRPDNDAGVRADVLELPHHGSHHETAERFVTRVGAGIVMQSTGWTRWQSDKWAASLAGIERLVTVRDGACWIEIDHGGAMQTRRFLAQERITHGVDD